MKTAINYTIKGAGIPFVFQHGLGANLSQAVGILEGMTDFQLISGDASGHGNTPFNQAYLPSFDQYVEDLISLLDKLGIPQAIFGGISMGSGIALNMALRYPNRVKGLVLVRPAWLDYGSPENLKILLDIAQVLNKENGQEEFEQTSAFKEIQATLPLAAKSILGQFSRDQGTFTSQVLNCMVKDKPFESIEDLKNLEIPSLVIGNEDDPLHPWDMAVKIHQALPQSELQKVVSRYVNGAVHKTELQTAVSSFITNNFKD